MEAFADMYGMDPRTGKQIGLQTGDPREFAAACAFLCAATSGFMTGQNLQLDGGAYSALI